MNNVNPFDFKNLPPNKFPDLDNEENCISKQKILDAMLSNKQLNKISDNTQNVEIIIESFLQDLVITPAAYNIQNGVLSAIIEVSQINSSCELPTAQIHKTYNFNAHENARFNSDKSFGRLLVKTLSSYNIQFIKKKLSINGKTPQGIILEQESLELIKKLVNAQ